MTRVLTSRRTTALIFVGLLILLGLLLALLPPEQILGDIVKAVFLHGALVQVGLAAFAAAGVLGAVYLVWRRESIYQWCFAAQQTAVILWVVYALSSMVTTYLAWGTPIAWDEPRVRASFHVLWFATACLALAFWLSNRLFTAVINIVVAVMVWYLVKGAGLLRHPMDPIGTSSSTAYPLFFLAHACRRLAAGAVDCQHAAATGTFNC